jgi:hypothetical protein
VQYPIQMTVGCADGTSLYAFRYSSEGQSRTLFYSRDLPTLRQLHPDVAVLQEVHDETRIIVSEPLGDSLPGAWIEAPESHYGIVRPGDDLLAPLQPKRP